MMMYDDGCCAGGSCHTDDDATELNVQEIMEEVGGLLGSIDSILADEGMTSDEKIVAIDELLDPWRPTEDDEDEE